MALIRTCKKCEYVTADEIARFCSRCGAKLEMPADRFDAFISYRREGGSEIAALIKDRLEMESGYRIYLDVDTLGACVFDDRLIEAIKATPCFILIVSKGAFTRIWSEDDWLRKEIATALANKRVVVPVLMEGAPFPKPEELPPDIRELPRNNGIIYSHQLRNESFRKLAAFVQNAIETIEKASKEAQRPSQDIANSINTGNAKWHTGDYVGAIYDFTTVIESRNITEEQKSAALLGRGKARGMLGDFRGELEDYEAVLSSPSTRTELQIQAKLNIGISHRNAGNFYRAITVLSDVISDRDASPDQIAQALDSRGYCRYAVDDPTGGRQDVANAINVRGISKEIQDTVKKYLEAIDKS